MVPTGFDTNASIQENFIVEELEKINSKTASPAA